VGAFGMAIKHADEATKGQMFHNRRRDKATLVNPDIHPGTEIWTDQWGRGLHEHTSIPCWVVNGRPQIHKAAKHQYNSFNPINGASTQMIERAWRSAHLKLIKNANNNVIQTSLPGYQADFYMVHGVLCTRLNHYQIFNARYMARLYSMQRSNF
jgi:hypothetical protein